MKEILQQHKFDGEILEKPTIDPSHDCSTLCKECDKFVLSAAKHKAAQTVYELETMTEFVKKVKPNKSKNVQWISSKNAIDAERYLVIDKYADFITQPLTKEMFIGDGRIFEGNCVYSEDDRYIYMHWLTNGKTAIKLHETKTIEQALNNGVKLFWNGNTI